MARREEGGNEVLDVDEGLASLDKDFGAELVIFRVENCGCDQ